jgi:CDP-glycerol glycerophosphotransferase
MNHPKISVIVPIYNVEKYLKACLDSIAHQTYDNIEVIMVNDGSTDQCGAIMHHYADLYPNFHGYDKPNGGLGQARNFGVRHATGEYLAFVDSDDRVTADAYLHMVTMAEQTGSDIVIGNVLRFNAYKTFPSGIHRKAIVRTKRRTHITADPELIYDTTAWNKLYRTSFWNKHQFAFPEGMLYEDIPVTFPAHYLARSVDVLDETVYYWRFRNFGDHSITQSRTAENNLRDRLKAVEMVNRFFEEHLIDPELCEAKDVKVLSLDFMMYLNKLPNADQSYYDLFRAYVIRYLKDVPERVLLRLRPVDRLKYYFLEKEDQNKLFHLIRYQKTKTFRRSRLIRHEDGHYYAPEPFHAQVPEKWLRADDTLEVRQQAEKIVRHGSSLTIKGRAFIEKLDVRGKNQVSMSFILVDESGSNRIPIKDIQIHKSLMNSLRAAVSGRLSRPHFDWVYHYDWSSYEVVVPFSEPEFAALPEGTYRIVGKLRTHGLTRTFSVGLHPGSRKAGKVAGKYHQVILRVGGSGTIYLILNK